MNRIDEPRAVFYLRHQALIEKWAALGPSVAQLAHSFLCSCADDVAGLAPQLSPDAAVHMDLEGEWPKVLVFSRRWFGSSEGESVPKVGIGLEWNKKSRLNFATSPDCAYTGVRVNFGLADGRELSRKLKDAFAAAGLIKPHKLVTSPWWPAYRHEVAAGEYWENLAPYREQLVKSVRFFWREFEPRIRDVLAG
ncbi:hypothetical protein WME73_26950 [Sorangium sp. So ce302]|uniref:hypothetical protein n=1 Tax=Sorangium sp. So ce302 TaxID=3133297 RepID=UPI003F60307C